MDKKIVILQGVSSSGKTSIGNLFRDIGYDYIDSDNYIDKAIFDIYKNIKNEYINDNKIELQTKERLSYYIMQAINNTLNNKIIIVAGSTFKRNFNLPSIKILLYTSPNDLIRNVYNRNTKSPNKDDYRAIHGVFKNYTNKYISTEKEVALDVVNRQDFINKLKNTVKFLFRSEKDLIKFGYDVFKNLNIYDNNNHYIKLRNIYKYDYICKTQNKTLKEIFSEIKNFVDN